MVEVSADRGAARRTIFCRNVRQNTARIARTVGNTAICGDIVRSVLTTIFTRPDGSIARISQIPTAD